MIEREMEDLIATHAEEFFPRHVLVLKGRQGTLAGVGRFDLLFEDQFENKILIDRKSTRLNSSHQIISYAVFCLKKKNKPATARGLCRPPDQAHPTRPSA